MTTDSDVDNVTCLHAPTAPQQDERLALFDRVFTLVEGKGCDDVLRIAIAMMMECCVQRTNSKPAALDLLNCTYQQMAAEINSDYDGLKGPEQKTADSPTDTYDRNS